jgi:hypothetical protein
MLMFLSSFDFNAVSLPLSRTYAAAAADARSLVPFSLASLRAYNISAKSLAISKVASGLAAVNAQSRIRSNILPSVVVVVEANHSSTVSAMPSGSPL